MELAEIRPALSRLRAASPPPRVFGAQAHRFVLGPALPEREVAAFEQRFKIVLPGEYRRFLTEVGNGGAGPHYGLLKLGERLDMRDMVRWEENDGSIGVPSEPFPHARPWNDLTGAPTEGDEESDDFDERTRAFQERYFRPHYMNGAIPIAELGCALSEWLVVTGPEAGHVWCDFRGDYRGILPLSIGSLERVTFLEWYGHWLHDALAKLAAGDVAEPIPEIRLREKPWWKFW